MSIVVTNTYRDVETTLNGAFIREAKLAITGLTAGSNNTVAHGLPAIPFKVTLATLSLTASEAGLWGEAKAADSTSIYVAVASGGATAGTIYVEY